MTYTQWKELLEVRKEWMVLSCNCRMFYINKHRTRVVNSNFPEGSALGNENILSKR
ncbi:15984_t:CDS:1, partial [Funneliformis geosporum]